MKKIILMLLICIATLSCNNNEPELTSPLGFWLLQRVDLNGINAVRTDFTMANYLDIKDDKTLSRCYDRGKWGLADHALTIDWDSPGGTDWTYKIIDQTQNTLTLQVELTESQYNYDFNEFSDDEIITITEFYKKTN